MGGQRKALIVANDQYDHEGMQNLRAPSADADALSRVLADPQIGGFDVQAARNEPVHLVQVKIEEFLSETRADDVLLLHFSCHGLKNESGELFFAARDTRPNRLRATAISADFIQKCMRQSRSRSIVLLLDCCYGGAFSQGVTVRAAGDVNVFDSFPAERLGGARGRAVITASSAMEYAFEDERLADDQGRMPSVFTSAVVAGLETGEADRDEDGWVSLDEFYDYVFDWVRERNPHQTPSRDVQMQGEFYLARSSRRPIRPAPIPPDLEAARTDPNMYTRLGAVSELRTRLVGDNLPAAAGSYEALQEMVRTDNRLVAEAAETALRVAAVHPEKTELRFGSVQQGTKAPDRVIRLLGPPIARACVLHPSQRWIRSAETADGFAISVDTSQAGGLHGSVDIKGYAGQVSVSVEADVIPAPAPPQPPPPDGEQTPLRSRPPRQTALAAITPVAGALLLCIPLAVLAVYLATAQATPLPGQWSWMVLLSAAIGVAVAAVEYRRSRIWAAALEVAFIWSLLYAAYRLTPASVHRALPLPRTVDCATGALVKWPSTMAIVAGTGAVISASLCAVALVRSFGRRRNVHPFLPVFLGCMTLALGLESIGNGFYISYPNCNRSLIHAGGVILIVALLVNLAAVIVALIRKRQPGSRQPTEPTEPTGTAGVRVPG